MIRVKWYTFTFLRAAEFVAKLGRVYSINGTPCSPVYLLLFSAYPLYLLLNYENLCRSHRTGPITSDYTAISYLPGVPRYERKKKEAKRKSYPDKLRYTPLLARCWIQRNWIQQPARQLNNAKS